MIFLPEHRKLILVAVIFLLVSCGGGGGGSDSSLPSASPSQPVSPTPIPIPPEAGLSLSVSVLYDPLPKDARAKYLIDLGLNRPKITMTNTFYKADDVPQSTIDGIENSLQAVADYLGHYDIKYFAYGNTYEGSESVAIEYCNLWQDQFDISEGRGCSRFTDKLADGFGTGNANAASPGFSVTEDYWVNSEVWKNPPNTIEHYVGDYGRFVDVYSKIVMHEYTHIHQLRPQLNTTISNDGNETRAMPGWFLEGGAELFAILAVNEVNGLDNLDDEYLLNLNELKKNKYNLPSITERLQKFGRSQSYEYADYALSVYAVGYMISRTDIQKVYMDLINNVYTKGWEQAFLDTMGFNLETFYQSFEEHMSQSDSILLASLPRPINLKNSVSPIYPIPRLQIEGALSTANSGGQPSALKRTVYYFKDDSSMIPLYQGLSWPYVTASSEATINKESNITAVIEVTGSGYVSSSNLPLYQYNLDTTPASALGEGVSDQWHTLLPNGTSSENLGFRPKIND